MAKSGIPSLKSATKLGDDIANEPVRSKLQTFFQDQLSSDGDAQTVLDVGTVVSIGDGIAKVYGCEA